MVPLPADLLMGGHGGMTKVVLIGGTFERKRASRDVDRHFLFGPWGRRYSGAELHALLVAYALGQTDQGERRRGLLWVVDHRYPLVLLVPVLLAGWHRPSIHGWFAGLYVLGAMTMGVAWPVVLPLWPAWLTIVLTYLRGGRE